MVVVAACSVPNPWFGSIDTRPTTDGESGSMTVTSEPTGSGATDGTMGSTSGTTTEETTGGALCGDGIVQAGEACDDANADDSDGCLTNCQLAACGDGIVFAGVEACDDGNDSDVDACLSACVEAFCGDGIVREGVEACDDGNPVDDDGCTAGCALSTCGDGEVDPGEECDDGNTIDEDECTNVCLEPACGDGVKQEGEACDDGNDATNDDCILCIAAICGDSYTNLDEEQCDDGPLNGTYEHCPQDCDGPIPKCGDSIVNGNEQCDDGNGVDDDGCTSKCAFPSCGDGMVQAGEECDDGNNFDNDDCSAGCTQEKCGDNVVQQGEECDDANDNDHDMCLGTCKAAKCGDGVVFDNVEACDDGDGDNGNECTNACKKAICGDGIKWAGVEECDDGNKVNTDGCVNNCKAAKCGDGILQNGETCDDGPFNNMGSCGPQCSVMVSPNCGDGIVQVGEECDKAGGPLGVKYPALCQNDCRLPACVRVTNSPMADPVFLGNDWLTGCTDIGGDKLVIALYSPQGVLVYAAEGKRPGAWLWKQGSMTAGEIGAENEWSFAKHDYPVTITSIAPTNKSGAMMVTSKIAEPEGEYSCEHSLGDGYGIGLFESVDKPDDARLLVMGRRGGVTGNQRALVGFTDAMEISFSEAEVMHPCGEAPNLKGFLGKFVMALF